MFPHMQTQVASHLVELANQPPLSPTHTHTHTHAHTHNTCALTRFDTHPHTFSRVRIHRLRRNWRSWPISSRRRKRLLDVFVSKQCNDLLSWGRDTYDVCLCQSNDHCFDTNTKLTHTHARTHTNTHARARARCLIIVFTIFQLPTSQVQIYAR